MQDLEDAALYKMVCLSKNKSLKMYENISKLHFASLRC